MSFDHAQLLAIGKHHSGSHHSHHYSHHYGSSTGGAGGGMSWGWIIALGIVVAGFCVWAYLRQQGD